MVTPSPNGMCLDPNAHIFSTKDLNTPINILAPLQLSHKDLDFEKGDLEEMLEPRFYETELYPS